jgi:hypothetical protein
MQEVMGRPLTALLGEVKMAEVAEGLRQKRSLLSILGERMLDFCTQVSHVHPWAVVVLLEASADSTKRFSNFNDVFMLCPRDLRCGDPPDPTHTQTHPSTH